MAHIPVRAEIHEVYQGNAIRWNERIKSTTTGTDVVLTKQAEPFQIIYPDNNLSVLLPAISDVVSGWRVHVGYPGDQAPTTNLISVKDSTGTTTYKSIAFDEWCEFVSDGTDWYVFPGSPPSASSCKTAPTVFYASPTTQGTGDGLTLANAATLMNILTVKSTLCAQKGGYIVIYLTSGYHVLTSEVTLSDYLYIRMESIQTGVNRAIICTPNTVLSQISENVTGNPSPSQTCAAHNLNESLFTFNNSHVVFKNVVLHATRRIIQANYSYVEFEGANNLKIWGYVVSASFIEGVCLRGISSDFLCETITFNIYHADYSLSPANTTVSPCYFYDCNIRFSSVTWIANTQINIGSSISGEATGSALKLLNGTKCSLSSITLTNVIDAFYLRMKSELNIQSLVSTGNVRMFCFAEYGSGAKIPTNITAIANTDNFLIKSAFGSDVTIVGTITATGTVGTLFLADLGGKITSQTTINAADRAGNSGTSLAYNATRNGNITIFGNVTTRNTGTDKVAVGTYGSQIIQPSGTNTCSTPIYSVSTGARYISPAGVSYGVY